MLNVIMHNFDLSQKMWGKHRLPHKIISKKPHELSDSYHNIS